MGRNFGQVTLPVSHDIRPSPISAQQLKLVHLQIFSPVFFIFAFKENWFGGSEPSWSRRTLASPHLRETFVLPACTLVLGHSAGTNEAVSKTQEQSTGLVKLGDLVTSPSLHFFSQMSGKLQPLLSEMSIAPLIFGQAGSQGAAQRCGGRRLGLRDHLNNCAAEIKQ